MFTQSRRSQAIGGRSHNGQDAEDGESITLGGGEGRVETGAKLAATSSVVRVPKCFIIGRAILC